MQIYLFLFIVTLLQNLLQKGSSSHVMGLRYTEANLRVAQKKENSVIYLEDNYEANYDGFDPNSPESIIAFSLSQTTYLDQSILIAQKIQEQFKNRVKEPTEE